MQTFSIEKDQRALKTSKYWQFVVVLSLSLLWVLIVLLFASAAFAQENSKDFITTRKILEIRSPEDRAKSYARLGFEAWKIGNSERAGYYFKKSRKLAPNDAMGSYAMAHFFLSRATL